MRIERQIRTGIAAESVVFPGKVARGAAGRGAGGRRSRQRPDRQPAAGRVHVRHAARCPRERTRRDRQRDPARAWGGGRGRVRGGRRADERSCGCPAWGAASGSRATARGRTSSATGGSRCSIRARCGSRPVASTATRGPPWSPAARSPSPARAGCASTTRRTGGCSPATTAARSSTPPGTRSSRAGTGRITAHDGASGRVLWRAAGKRRRGRRRPGVRAARRPRRGDRRARGHAPGPQHPAPPLVAMIPRVAPRSAPGNRQ